MIKRLTYFTEDAWSLDWEQFKVKHNCHVIVMVPIPSPSSDKGSTDRYDAVREDEVRPPINSEYRVGLLSRPGQNVEADMVKVGRGPDSDIVVSNIEVSKNHAVFERQDGKWFIRDCGSTNGTYLNGDRIEPDKRAELESSDYVKIGPGVSAVFFNPGDFYQFLRSNEVREHLAE